MQIRISGPIPEGLNVFETMRAAADGRIAFWELHFARLRRDCAAVGFEFDEAEVKAALAGLPQGEELRVRLAVDASGKVSVTHQPLPPKPPFWTIAISQHRLSSEDPWQKIKTSHRPIYDAARADMPPGCDEVILLNELDEVCEGSITNLFLRRNGQLFTPALSSGVLPGILRQSFLMQGNVKEIAIFPENLRQGKLFCGNALRGLIPAKLIHPEMTQL